MAKKRWRQWRTSEKIIVAVIAAPFVFLIWSAFRSSAYDADMEQRVQSSFQPVECSITSVGYTELRSRSNGPSSTRQMAPMVVSGYDIHAEYTYSVNGVSYTSRRIRPRYRTIPTLPEAQAFVVRYPAHKTFTCYYDPSSPAVAFLEK